MLKALVLLLFVKISLSDYTERRLYRNLLQNIDRYGRLERPVENSTHKVTVYLGVILQQLVDVDEKNQILELNAWLKYIWNDYKLRWNPEEYDGISDIRLPSQKMIWKPDVLLYNSVDPNFDSTFPTNVVVYSDGTTNWIPPGIFKISCKIDIKWFPFDDQDCFFKFGSWTYDGTKMDLQPDEKGFDMSDYINNGEWLIKGTTVIRKEKFYACCPEPYPDLKFIMHLRRRTLYYGFNLIVPCVLMTVMTLFGFILPPGAGEKIALQITVLLAICVFLQIVSDMTPPTSEAVPLLGIFFCCCMIDTAVSVVFTVIVLNLHHRKSETHHMGKLTRLILLHWIPWILFMRKPGKPTKRHDLPSLFDFKRQNRSLDNGVSVESVPLDKRINKCFKVLSLKKHDDIATETQANLVLLQRIYAELRFITKRMNEKYDAKIAENEWKFAAKVVDRLCLLVFSILITSSTLLILFSAPYLA